MPDDVHYGASSMASTRRPTPQLTLDAWFQDYPDPQNWLSLYWTCDSTLYAERVGYCNPAFDALVEQADARARPGQAAGALRGGAAAADRRRAGRRSWYNPPNVALVKPHVTGYATTPIDLWPGSMTPLTLALASAAADEGGATPESASAGPAEFVWATRGGPDHPLDMPAALAIDPEGNLWVTDGNHSRFQLFAPDGTFLEAWGTPGSGDGQFAFERADGAGLGGVAFDVAGNLYVVDTGNFRVQRFDPDRRFVAAWGSEGEGDGQFLDPIGIAVGPDDRVFVIDDGRNDVQVFNTDGAFLLRFGGPGVGDGKIFRRRHRGRHRPRRHDPGGRLRQPSNRALHPRRRVPRRVGQGRHRSWAAQQPGRVGRGRPGPRFCNRLPEPSGAGLRRRGTVPNRLGRPRHRGGAVHGAGGIALDGAGHVYVSDYDLDRVQQFRLRPPLAPPDSTPTP